ncbi:MAG: hypothetical protein STHCBS139747_006498 [Sporothrix thermara]
MHFSSLVASAVWATAASAFPHIWDASDAAARDPHAALAKRCTNSADDRGCWGDYDINTNYYETAPDTGVVREYWWEITNTTAAPDGIERTILSINGTVPGPTIYADWGDTVVVHVTNSLANNGSSLHFHGIRQYHTNQNDGVTSLTQCPIAPGASYTYTWKAAQYGSSWYHSHYYVQAWDGVFGGIQINGPATANYDEDLGVLILNDWMHETADALLVQAEHSGPPKLNGGLLNGTNTYTDSATGTTTGQRYSTTFTAGQRYRLRLVNAAADTQFRFSIDNHTLQVIAADFVPIVPYATESISISMGQRYDVIVTANATTVVDNADITDFWMRAVMVQGCSNNDSPNNVLGIVRYDAASTADPTTTAWASATDDGTAACEDEPMASLVPYVPVTASSSPVNTTTFAVNLYTSNGIGLWEMGKTSFVSQWDYPTLLQVSERNDTWGESQNVYAYPEANTWNYLVVQTTNNAAHPLHMHGHDFWVLGQGEGKFDATTASLTLENPPRRDVVLLPGDGYVVIAFYTDNPGVWLIHCHIAWHTTEGLAIQLLEREAEIPALLDSALNETCAAWDAYVKADAVVQDDSGI